MPNHADVRVRRTTDSDELATRTALRAARPQNNELNELMERGWASGISVTNDTAPPWPKVSFEIQLETVS